MVRGLDSVIRAVVFDLDDTLISEREYVRSGFGAVGDVLARRYDFESSALAEELNALFDAGEKQVFNRLLERHHVDYEPRDIDELVAIYRRHEPNVVPFGDAIVCVRALKARGINIGIITDGYVDSQAAKMRVVEPLIPVDCVILTETLGRGYWKPHPRAFEEMANHFDISIREIMYIGDNPAKDFLIGSTHGVTTVRISRPQSVYSGVPYLEGVKEHHFIESLTEVIDLVDKANRQASLALSPGD